MSYRKATEARQTGIVEMSYEAFRAFQEEEQGAPGRLWLDVLSYNGQNEIHWPCGDTTILPVSVTVGFSGGEGRECPLDSHEAAEDAYMALEWESVASCEARSSIPQNWSCPTLPVLTARERMDLAWEALNAL